MRNKPVNKHQEEGNELTAAQRIEQLAVLGEHIAIHQGCRFEEAKEVSQEAIRKMLQASLSGDGDVWSKAYLNATIRSVIVSFARKRNCEREALATQKFEGVCLRGNRSEDPLSEVLAADLKRRICRRLEGRDREWFLAFVDEGKRYDEIAEAASVPVSTVRTVFWRIRTMIKEMRDSEEARDQVLRKKR